MLTWNVVSFRAGFIEFRAWNSSVQKKFSCDHSMSNARLPFQIIDTPNALDKIRISLACQLAHRNALAVAVNLVDTCMLWDVAPPSTPDVRKSCVSSGVICVWIPFQSGQIEAWPISTSVEISVSVSSMTSSLHYCCPRFLAVSIANCCVSRCTRWQPIWLGVKASHNYHWFMFMCIRLEFYC